ncbi:MAG: 3'-5' exonuclease [Bacteroidetes bacterium]|nr:3'-5' exonuclease [Bacteroidota bacterium]
MLPILKKPIVFFDLETTGISTSKDRIIELFILKIMPDESEFQLHQFFNPGIPISAEATAVHGITDEDVKNEPSFAEKADELILFLENCDFAGFNSNKFDVPILVEEFYRVGIELNIDERKFIDIMRIFHTMEPRNLSAAYRFYCDKEIDKAHSAKFDTLATFHIFKAQLDKYSNIDKTVEGLHKLSASSGQVDLAGRIIMNAKNEEIFNFGKHKGKKVIDVFKTEPSYYNWIMDSDFAIDTKNKFTKIRLRMLGE